MVLEKLPNNLGIQFNHVKPPKPDPNQPSPSPPPFVHKSNYMNPTSSSDRRKDHRTQASSRSNKNLHERNTKHGSSSKLFGATTSNKGSGTPRATCSSTLKDSKSPNHLKLNLGGNEARGASVAKVCKYKHCSLNDPPLPPLKAFLKSRRHSLKTQKSVTKIEAQTPQRLKIIGFEENNEVEFDTDIEWDEGWIRSDNGSDLKLGSSDIPENVEITVKDVPVDQEVQEVIEDEIHFDDSDLESEESKPCPSNQISDDDDNHDHDSTSFRKRMIGGKKVIGDGEEGQREVGFREPDFRPLEAEPEAGRVELRKQVMDERKDGQEWMLDYAMQRTVAGLGPARKKNVAMLVQAFEKVLPKSEPSSRLVCPPRKLNKVWVGI